MIRVLVLGRDDDGLAGSLQARLSDAISVGSWPDEEAPCAGRELETCDVAIGGAIPDGFLERAGRLHYWIIPFAGIPPALRTALRVRPDIVILNSHHNAIAVAEHAWALLLAAAKRLVAFDAQLRRGDWSGRYAPAQSNMLRGATLLLVGYGAIGKAIVPYARAFGMRVMAVKRTLTPAPELDRIGDASGLDRMLPEADFILLCLPRTDRTEGLFGRAEFSIVKRGAVLVNVGRGSVIEESAFAEALDSGVLGAAAIDTWWVYPADDASRACTPPSRIDMSGHKNLVFSPHRASHVVDGEEDWVRSIAEILESIARGTLPRAVDLDEGY